MRVRFGRRGVRGLVAALALVGSTLLLPAAPALAGSECDGVPECVTVSSGQISLGHLATKTRRLFCPSDAPWQWGWSWDKSSSAVSVIPAGIPFNSASFTATNWSVIHDNTVTFYIGCSPKSSIPPGSRR